MNKDNLLTPAFLSRYILWNKVTINSAVNYLENQLNIKIKLEI